MIQKKYRVASPYCIFGDFRNSFLGRAARKAAIRSIEVRGSKGINRVTFKRLSNTLKGNASSWDPEIRLGVPRVLGTRRGRAATKAAIPSIEVREG